MEKLRSILPSPPNLPDQPVVAVFAAAFKSNQQAASLTRLHDGLVIDVNDAWLALTGFERSQVVGKTTLELGIWGKAAQRSEAFSKTDVLTRRLSVEAVLTTQDKRQLPVRFSGTQFEVNQQIHMLGFVHDLRSEPFEAKESREKLDFIEKLTQRAPVILFQYRIRPDGSGHFPYVSQAILGLFGVDPADVVRDGTVALDRVHADDVHSMNQAIRESYHTLKPWQLRFRVNLPSGELRWLLGDAVPERQPDGSTVWYGSFADITKRKLEFDELEQTRKQMVEKTSGLQIALDNMAQGILRLDADTRITQYNQRLLELLDIDQATMDGLADGTELLEFQRSRGDFGANFSFVETSARPLIASDSVKGGPDQYLRRTRGGRTLEIKTTPLADGGVVRTFADVTHFVEAQAALHKSESRFRDLTELSSDWYWEQDAQHRFVNVVGENFLSRGIDAESYIGRTRWDSGILGVSAEQWDEHRRIVKAHRVFRDFEYQRIDGSGQTLWISVSGMPMFDAEGEFSGYRGVGRDISEQKRREDEAQRLAFYDTLTGLPNRRLLLDRLGQSLISNARSQRHGAVLFLDLDNFKDLNDTQGHDVGDVLLEKVANRLTTCVRQGDTVGRFGGDEFVVMLENLDDNLQTAIEQAGTVANKILATLNLPFDLKGKSHYSTPSIGITLFNGKSDTIEELLKRADLAMYQAKAAGRNTLRFFDPEMQAAVAARAALETELRLGMERGELVLHYQPVVNQQGRTTGLEALVRWQHPVRGLVPPNDFIPVAEQTGLILQLGQWVLKTVCRQLVAWQSHTQARQLSIAVNVSAREFRQSDFVQRILSVVNESGANPNLLKLELTESLLVDDINDAIAKMTALRAVGVRFALDDFGTGYSSLSYLKRLPLDELKIDQSFVRDVLTDNNDAAIARTIVALAISLGLDVVAEGVENNGQRDFLTANGCLSFQGYNFGRPTEIDEVLLDDLASGFAPTYQPPL